MIRINDKREPAINTFGEIKKSEPFIKDDTLYIKLPIVIQFGGADFNSFNVSTGHFNRFNDGTFVQSVDIEVNISEAK